MAEEPPKRRMVRPPTRGEDKARATPARLKTAYKRTPSQQAWLERQINDPFAAEARAKGYRSRAAFKLMEIDDRLKILRRGSRVKSHRPGLRARRLDPDRLAARGRGGGRRRPLARRSA